MGWQAAVVGALGVAQYQQQGALVNTIKVAK